MIKTLLAAAIALAAHAAAAQHSYAGEQHRDIKSLSASAVSELLAGQGMGLAKAAELNGFPGPAHVLEHALALGLAPAQEAASRDLLQAHKERARHLGAELVAAERALDRSFAERRIDEASLRELTAAIGRLQARLREEHLRTHLAQAALLSEPQVRSYAQLRGYADAAPAPQHGRH